MSGILPHCARDFPTGPGSEKNVRWRAIAVLRESDAPNTETGEAWLMKTASAT